MAYAFTATITRIGVAEVDVLIVETECGPTSEATITGLPVRGTVLRQQVDKTAGSATTADPILRTAAALGGRVVCENETPSLPVDTQGTATYRDESPSSSLATLFHRSRPDVGTDNSFTVVYHLKDGW